MIAECLLIIQIWIKIVKLGFVIILKILFDIYFLIKILWSVKSIAWISYDLIVDTELLSQHFLVCWMYFTLQIILIVDAVDVWKFFIAFSFFIYEILNSCIRLPVFFNIDCKVRRTGVELFYSFAENGYVSSFLLGLAGCDRPLIRNYVHWFLRLLIKIFLILLVSRKYSSFAILDLLLLDIILNLISIILIWFFIGLNLNYGCFARLKHILVSSLNDEIRILLLDLFLSVFNQFHILVIIKLEAYLSIACLRKIIYFILNGKLFQSIFLTVFNNEIVSW